MSWLLLLAALAYPLLVHAGLQVLPPQVLALVLLLLLAARTALARSRGQRRGAIPRDTAGTRLLPSVALPLALLAIAALTLGATALTGDRAGLLFLPVLINAGLFIAFGASVLRPPTIVEAIARAQVGNLSPAEVRYCRSVTSVWCAFFVLNGSVAATFALGGMVQAWTLWCGLLSYLGMGLLFAAERSYRAWRFRRYAGGPVDALLRHVFPPRVDSESPDDRTVRHP